MNPIRIVALIFAGVLALTLTGAGVYILVIGGDRGDAALLFAGAAVPAAVVYELARGRRDRDSIPPTIKILVAGVLVGTIATVQGCAGVQRTACSIWDGTHHVACRLCEQTEGGCPFGPEQGHSHEPEEP